VSLKIYGIAASRASRPLWVAHELGLAYEHIEVPFTGGATRTPEFLALNPNGHIPVVDDHGIVVWESMACALYLAERYARGDGVRLAASSPAEQAEILRWIFWTVTALEKDALTVLMHTQLMPAERRKPALAQEAVRRLASPMRVIEAHLAGRAFLAGARFTVADVCVASVLAWVRGSGEVMSACPNAAAWLEQCLERPAQQQVRALARMPQPV
jgi:glutathione S-transferase